MRTFRSSVAGVALATLLAAPLAAQWPTTEPVDLDALYRLKDEGMQRSKVMEIESYLTDVYGPRLTNSPELREAAEWAQKTMKSWGLANVHTESFPFGRGWQNRRMVAMALTPRAYPLIAYPKAWTPGTRGVVTGEAIVAIVNSERDFDTWRGKLRGKFVLTLPTVDVPAHFDAPGRRFTDAELTDLARQPRPRRPGGGGGNAGQAFARARMKFFADEGVAALLDYSRRGNGPNGDGGTVFVQAAANVSRDPKAPLQPAQITLAVEQYGRIARTLEKHIPVTLSVDVDNLFLDADQNAFNIVGEIPGTDKASEIVMIGAHFDSWHTGTGATDNAAGSAVMMEAMRILKTSGVPLRRTVRIALWSEEEQGLLGSKAYVAEHFADPATMALKPEHAKLSAYFNVDNGTGQIRGVYLQGNEAIAPIFQSWMEPFRNMGMATLAIRDTTGTDHLSFDAVGLPGFQFIQDEIEYNARTHHSNMDVYERVQPDDMMRNAVIVASFALDAANREDRLPRKPLPKPLPPQPAATN
jgi:hypothetical protein